MSTAAELALKRLNTLKATNSGQDIAPETTTPTPEAQPVDESKTYADNRFGAGTYDNTMKLDPSTPYLENFYINTIKQPTPISEKGIENARLASGIGEGLQTLGDIFGASRGARTQERDFSNSPIAQQTRNEKDVRNLYDQKQSQYNNGLLNAKIGDYAQGEQTQAQNRAIVLQSLQQHQQAQYQAAKERQDLQLKLMDFGYKDKDIQLALNKFDEEKRNNRAKNAIDNARAKADLVRANNDGGNLVIPVPAHPNDPNAVVNPITKQRMANIPIAKKDIDAYYTRAMNDAQFFTKHPTLRSGDGRRVPFKDADKNAIAITQAQDEYNSQFGTDQPAAQSKYHTPSMVPTKTVPGF